jgi:hypothetical protein
VITKVLAGTVILLVVGRFLVRRNPELSRRFKIFVDVCLVLMLVTYATRLAMLYAGS